MDENSYLAAVAGDEKRFSQREERRADSVGIWVGGRCTGSVEAAERVVLSQKQAEHVSPFAGPAGEGAREQGKSEPLL